MRVMAGIDGKAVFGTVLLLAAAGYGVYAWNSSGPGLPPDKLPFACAETCKLFWLERGTPETRMYPVKNPETGRFTLLLVVRTPEGQWRVPDMDKSAVRLLTDEGLNNCVDAETLAVRVE